MSKEVEKVKPVSLTLKDRLILGHALPTKGDATSMIIVRDIAKKVEINQEEIEKYKIKSVGQQTTWNCADVFSYEFSAPEKELLKKTFEDLSNKKELSAELLDLYQAFTARASD